MPNVRQCSPAEHAAASVAHMRLPHACLVFATCCLVGCMLDSSPKLPTEAPPIGAAGDTLDAGTAQPRSSTSAVRAARADAGSGRDATPTDMASKQAEPADEDAGATIGMPAANGGSPGDAGVTTDVPTGPTQPSAPATPPTGMASGDPECTRDVLRSKADAYFKAMASGETTSLRLHAAVRYTENGRDTQLGAGVWLRRPSAGFMRHVLDETKCSSVSEAVVNALTARIIVAVRLLYQNGQLLEVEAQTVPDDATLTNIDAIIPMGSDPWVEAVPEALRMSRETLSRFADQYFDAATGGREVPASTPECRRRQNGIPMEQQGSCNVAPGSMRFEQRRFPVVDETTGIFMAAVLYNNHLGFYLFKMAGDRMQNIEVLGGATTASSGW